MDLANKIKTLRQQKGLSQEELALKSNLSLRTIQEACNPIFWLALKGALSFCKAEFTKANHYIFLSLSI